MFSSTASVMRGRPLVPVGFLPTANHRGFGKRRSEGGGATPGSAFPGGSVGTSRVARIFLRFQNGGRLITPGRSRGAALGPRVRPADWLPWRWRVFGPILPYDLLTSSRRGRWYLFRVVLTVVMFVVFWK